MGSENQYLEIMKTRQLFAACMLLLLALGITSCSLDDDSPKDWSEFEIFTVSDHTVMRRFSTLFSKEGVQYRPHLELIDSKGNISYMIGIKGFNYEEGYQYRIKVKIIHLADPPQDGSSLEYVLEKVLSKEKVY